MPLARFGKEGLQVLSSPHDGAVAEPCPNLTHGAEVMIKLPGDFDAAVLVGRFQPFHNAHLALLGQALALAPRVFVALGSAYQARSPRNPWLWQERAAWIREAVAEGERDRLTFLPTRDYYDEPRWRARVVAGVREGLAGAVSGPPRVTLVGHFKDATSYYLEGFGDWHLTRVSAQGTLSATALREEYFGMAQGDCAAHPAGRLGPVVPASTAQFLAGFAGTSDYAYVQAEWLSLKRYQAAWSSAPFPPVFVTVDAVVTCGEHVLLIRRGHAPAKGQLALPGGFLDQNETTHQSALRELAEETGLGLGARGIPCTLVAKRPFDYPTRSQRGRTITHAFHFDVSTVELPEVRAGDDAAAAEWVERDRLLALEDQFFEDHLHILDTFLGLGVP